MKREEWARIAAARDLLGLGEKASLAEIKKAFRGLSRRLHPDVAGSRSPEAGRDMAALNEAYKILLDYCANFRFPLTPAPTEPPAPEDWWLDRFGDDPLWGPGKK